MVPKSKTPTLTKPQVVYNDAATEDMSRSLWRVNHATPSVTPRAGSTAVIAEPMLVTDWDLTSSMGGQNRVFDMVGFSEKVLIRVTNSRKHDIYINNQLYGSNDKTQLCLTI